MSNVFQTCLKGFKLKNLVVEPKTVQPVEPDEEPVDPQLNRSRCAKKNSLYSIMVVQLIKIEPQPVKVQSRTGRGPTVTCQALNANS